VGSSTCSASCRLISVTILLSLSSAAAPHLSDPPAAPFAFTPSPVLLHQTFQSHHHLAFTASCSMSVIQLLLNETILQGSWIPLGNNCLFWSNGAFSALLVSLVPDTWFVLEFLSHKLNLLSILLSLCGRDGWRCLICSIHT
jgi:hypothetical protein